MTVNCDNLWELLNERNILKTALSKAAKISTNAMTMLGKNEKVRLGVLVNICKILFSRTRIFCYDYGWIFRTL